MVFKSDPLLLRGEQTLRSIQKADQFRRDRLRRKDARVLGPLRHAVHEFRIRVLFARQLDKLVQRQVARWEFIRLRRRMRWWRERGRLRRCRRLCWARHVHDALVVSMGAWREVFAHTQKVRHHAQARLRLKARRLLRRLRRDACVSKMQRRSCDAMETRRLRKQCMAMWVTYYERYCFRDKAQREEAHRQAERMSLALIFRRLVCRICRSRALRTARGKSLAHKIR